MAKSARKVAKKKAARKAVRKAPKKTARKISKVTKKSPQSRTLPVTLFVIAAFVAIYAIATLLTGSAPQPVIAASVNGVEITTEQLETQYAILPEEYKALYTKSMILQQLVDEEVLIAYGEAQGLSVTEEAVNEEIQRILASGQITITELQENLERFSLTIEDFEALIERKILIELSMSSLLESMGSVTEEDARAYYDANAAQYVEEEQVTVRHILIASQRDNAAQLSKDLKESIESGEDFCQFVTDETDDKGSVDNCGEYTFAHGRMVPEFEAASFEMSVDDVTVVQTVFGYHIIQKLTDVPARDVAFGEVKDDILALLNQQTQVTTYKDFLDEQKATSDIQIFYEE